ncbi:MAG: heavy-metal-associated domain-containing protein [Desulfobulbaceae bacterium]|nr:MAG: heavy-metal-associated domain-containing protein [Desulfobulbaceae bacterium]
MQVIKIKGMSCQHCVASTTKALEELPGVSRVSVDLEAGEAKYEGDIDKAVVSSAIEKIGFEVIE